uniref:Uncharacterized protein n=1 Tax=Anguilla anguilla TaxID=7936 RepID=A0A0E9PN05_ANGAN
MQIYRSSLISTVLRSG